MRGAEVLLASGAAAVRYVSSVAEVSERSRCDTFGLWVDSVSGVRVYLYFSFYSHV